MWRASRPIVMTGVLWGLLLAGAASGDEQPGLQVGDMAPDFVGLDDRGQLWNSRNHIGQKLLVVYFYPSDFSFCCTRQAVRYRDQMKGFRDLGAEVVGISGDAVEAHRQFSNTHRLSFPLLSDKDGEVARHFGVPLRVGGKAVIADEAGHEIVDARGRSLKVPRNVTTGRWTFVIDQKGQVIQRATDVNPIKDAQEVLDFVREYQRKNRPAAP